jgi:hypothetical protein
MRNARLARCVVSALLLTSCAGGTTGGASVATIAPSTPSPPYPAQLAATVYRLEEQGIDYSSTVTMSFGLTLDSRGLGDALRTERGTDVSGSDLHPIDTTVHYSARARWEAALLVVSLTAREPRPLVARDVVLRCERWTPDMRVEGSNEVADPALPGVDWICALPAGTNFLLGRVALQNVPREGEFILLGENHTARVDESVSQSARTIVTRRGD